MKKTTLTLLAGLLLASTAVLYTSCQSKPGTFEIGDQKFLLNGDSFTVKAAEVHYPRIPREYWEHRIEMCKALGMNSVCIYIFWNIHEQQEGVYDFTGNNDIRAFCKLAQKHGMYVIVRPGPYVCAEWEMGGLPWWLLKKKDIRLREQDPYFMERVRLFELEVGKQLADLQITRGGPLSTFTYIAAYLYMKRLILILGVFSNGSAMISTRPILLYAGIERLTSAMI